MINLLLLGSVGCLVLLNFIITFLCKISNSKNIYAERCEIKNKGNECESHVLRTETDHKTDFPHARFPAISS